VIREKNLKETTKAILSVMFFLLTFLILLTCSADPSFAQKKKGKNDKNEKNNVDPEAEKRAYINELNKYWSFGWENYKNKQYKDAAKHFWKVVELDTIKRFPTLFRYLGDSYFKMEKPDSAKIVYEMGLERYPDDAYLHRLVGYFLAQTEQTDPAIEKYETVVRLMEEQAKADEKERPTLKDDLKQLASLYVKSDRRDDAIAAYNRALEMDPNDLEVQNNLAALIASTGDIEALIEARERLREQDPQNSQVRFELGKMYFDAGEYEKAIERFNEFLTLSPNDIGALEYVGNSYQRLDKFNEANAEYKKILEAQPENKKVLAEISRCYKSLGNFTTGRSFAVRALNLDNAFGLGWIALGEVYEASADRCVRPKGGKVDYDDKLVYELAYQQYRNAFGDPGYRREAENKSNYLAPVTPTNEDVFMHANQKRPTGECYQWIPDSEFGAGFLNALNRRLGK
jgi:superkiller protein 3